MNYKAYTIALLRSLADMKLSDKQAAQLLKSRYMSGCLINFQKRHG